MENPTIDYKNFTVVMIVAGRGGQINQGCGGFENEQDILKEHVRMGKSIGSNEWGFVKIFDKEGNTWRPHWDDKTQSYSKLIGPFYT